MFIHLGLCKTGTTFLQNVVFPYWMEKNNVQFINKLKVFELDNYSEKVFISNEGFTGGTAIDHIDYISCLRSTINIFGEDNKYMLTLRNNNELKKSLFKEKVKNGYSSSFNYFKKKVNMERTKNEILEFLRENIKNENLLILSYEELRKDPESFLKRIADFISVPPLTKAEIESLLKKQVNKSKSDFSIRIMTVFNKINWKWGTKILNYILP